LRFFTPQGRHIAPMRVKFDTEEWTEDPLLRAKFHPHRCNDKSIVPTKVIFLLRFYQRPAWAYPRAIFTKFADYTTFQDALAVKIWMDLLKGFRSYGGFKLRESGFPKSSAPLAAKVCVRPPEVFEVQERARGPLSPCQVWWGSHFTRHSGGQKR